MANPPKDGDGNPRFLVSPATPRSLSCGTIRRFSVKKRQLFACLLMALAAPCAATSVASIGFAELCQHAELIFEGHVTRIRSQQENSPPKIWTIVTFDVVDIIKGPVVGDQLEVAFLGGTVGDLTLRVSEMHIPEIDETGIYFVESLNKRQANPFVGWTQGHFLVVRDAENIKRVFTYDRRPIYSVNGEYETSQRALSTGRALGTETEKTEAAFEALSIDAFKYSIRQHLLEATE